MSDWVGYAVSVNCGETLGYYQGTIVEASGMTITLTKAFRNGFPYRKSLVTLNAADIVNLRIIEAPSERPESHSTVTVPRAARKSRTTKSHHEALPASPTSTGSPLAIGPSAQYNNVSNYNKSVKSRNAYKSASQATRSKPVEILGTRKNNNYAGSYGSGSTPKSRGHVFGGRGEPTGIPGTGVGFGAPHVKARRRNEACFGDHADPALDDDFDFEGNLALFDKRAVWETMRNSKPDLVRTADDSRYRHDENVLGGGGGGGACMVVPEELRGSMQYVTDEGVRVPSVSAVVRRRLWEGLRRHGLLDFALGMVARAACDVALRLVGGGRRLEARNAHQAPLVVCVAGPHRGGATGLAAARLLQSRGAALHALVAGPVGPACEPLRRELATLELDGVPLHTRAAALPAAPDLVLIALHDPLGESGAECGEAAAAEACAWARGTRAAVLCVEPAGGGWAGVAARACVLGLAVEELSPALGRVYLADVAAPTRLFADLHLRYRPPFGALPVLPLYPAHD